MKQKDISFETTSFSENRASFSSSGETDEACFEENEAESSGSSTSEGDWASPQPVAYRQVVPWSRRKYQPTFDSLHEEIVDLFLWLRPTPQEAFLRAHTVQKVFNALQANWPNANLFVFGSVAMDLYLPTSDIDITMYFEGSTAEDLHKAADIIGRMGCFENVHVVDKTSVPVVKFTDSATRFNIDVSLSTLLSQKAVHWVMSVKRDHPVLDPLVLVLKQFLARLMLNESFNGGLSSYGLILLVAHFLKVNPMGLCPVGSTLGVLLFSFLRFYGVDFDYSKYGLKFRGSAEIVAKEELATDMDESYCSSYLCLQDPLRPNNDVGRSAHNMMNVRAAFARAAYNIHHVFEECWRRDKEVIAGEYCGPMLSMVIDVPKELEEYRRETLGLAFAKVVSSENVCFYIPNGYAPDVPPPPLPFGINSFPKAGEEFDVDKVQSPPPASSPASNVGSAGPTCASPLLSSDLKRGKKMPRETDSSSMPVTFRPLSLPTGKVPVKELPATLLSSSFVPQRKAAPILTSSHCFMQLPANTECTNVSSGILKLPASTTVSKPSSSSSEILCNDDEAR